jgi:hypothetical protein
MKIKEKLLSKSGGVNARVTLLIFLNSWLVRESNCDGKAWAYLVTLFH